MVFVPVSDVDRAKAFYRDQVGFTEDFDTKFNDSVCVVQLTPPGSGRSIALLTGLPPGPGLESIGLPRRDGRTEGLERIRFLHRPGRQRVGPAAEPGR